MGERSSGQGERRETPQGRLITVLHRAVKWNREKVPPGARTLLGIAMIVAGMFGFLPLLGFWMIPVGGVLIALDIPPLRRRLMARLERKKRNKGGAGCSASK